MKFSVIIPTYNRGYIIQNAIESVLSQTYTNYELIVIDDGSTDNTKEVLNQYGASSRVKYYYKKNEGVSAARNYGIRRATGDIVSFLDSDDLWKENKLAVVAEYFTRFPSVGVIFTDLEKHHGTAIYPSFMRTTPIFSKMLPKGSEFQVVDKRSLYLCLLQEVPIKTPALSIRKEVLLRHELFNPNYVSSEDWELLLRLSKDEQFCYIDLPLVVVRISEDSLHIVESERDAINKLEFLTTARKEIKAGNDKAAHKAVTEGLYNAAKHLAWHYLSRNEKRKATEALLDGFTRTYKIGLLLRALKYGISI